MGQITIEIPQKLNFHYKIVSEELAEKILSYLEQLVKEENKIDGEILGLWDDSEESVEETARELPQNKNSK